MSESKSWDNYWAGSSAGVAFNLEGAEHPALDRFWQATLTDVSAETRILDVASGRGALLAHLPTADYRCCVSLDYSIAALSSQRQSYDFILPVAADAGQLPLKEGSFDLVVSQYGVEYGGADAVAALPSMLAPGGRIMLAMHCEDSVIYRECHANARALAKLQDSSFLPLAEEMFRAGYAVLKGQGASAEAAGAARALLGPFRGLGQLLQEFGEGVAGGTVMTLYRETARIQERIQHHVEQDVIDWLQTMAREIRHYQARMDSMMTSALSAQEFEARIAAYRELGIECQKTELLKIETGDSLAWVLVGVRHD